MRQSCDGLIEVDCLHAGLLWVCSTIGQIQQQMGRPPLPDWTAKTQTACHPGSNKGCKWNYYSLPFLYLSFLANIGHLSLTYTCVTWNGLVYWPPALIKWNDLLQWQKPLQWLARTTLNGYFNFWWNPKTYVNVRALEEFWSHCRPLGGGGVLENLPLWDLALCTYTKFYIFDTEFAKWITQWL